MADIDVNLFSQEWVAYHLEQTVPLSGGLSDRNSIFTVDGTTYVLHLVENDAELYMMREASNRGVAPHVYATYPEKKWAVMEYRAESTITPEIAADHPREIGAALKAAHEIPLFAGNRDGFMEANQKRWEYIQTQASLQQTPLANSLLEGASKAMKVFEEELQQISSLPPVNLHTDLHPRNLFWTSSGLQIIDWESSSSGHPYFDLASLSIFLGFNAEQEEELLYGYFGHIPTDIERKEYLHLKKIRWAYTSIVNTMWAFRLLEKNFTSLPIPSSDKTFRSYMQSFAESKEMPSLDFFVQVARLSLEEAEK